MQSGHFTRKALILSTLGALGMAVACGGDDEKSKSSTGGGGSTSTGGAPGGGASGGTGGTSGGAGGTAGAAGGSGGSGGIAGAGGASSGGAAGSDAGSDAGSVDTYVDCSNGNDTTGNGTLGAPFKTIEKAAGVAVSGQFVSILDGQCDETTEPKFNQVNGSVDFADGVGVKAMNPGKVTLQGRATTRSAGFKFLGSGSVSGVSFTRFGKAISASSGQLSVSHTSFNDVYQGRPIELSGTAVATLTPGTLTNYVGANQRGFALIQGTAKLTVTGGSIVGVLDSAISGDTIFSVRDQSELVLSGVTLLDNKLSGINVRNTAKARLIAQTAIKNTASGACCGQSAVRLSDNATLEMTDSKIESTPAPGIVIDDVSSGTGTAQQSVNLKNSSIVGSTSAAIRASATSGAHPTLTLEGATLTGNSGGISLALGGIVDIKSSFINDNKAGLCGAGVFLGGNAALSSLKIRGTELKNNCGAGVQFQGAAGSTFDLGRGDALGQNTLTGNGTTGVGGISLETAAALVAFAAGNTWIPSVQSASATGAYAVPGGQNKLDVTGVQTGANYVIKGSAAANITLRLAENACVPQATCN